MRSCDRRHGHVVAAVLAAALLAATGCAKTPERSAAPVAPSTSSSTRLPSPLAPVASVEEATSLDGSGAHLLPDREIGSSERVGTMTVEFGRPGAALPSVTHPLRSGDDAEKVEAALDQGFAFHQLHSAVPGDVGTAVIGGHRVTRLAAPEFGHPFALFDADRIRTVEADGSGDPLVLVLEPRYGNLHLTFEAQRHWIADARDPAAVTAIFAQDPHRSVLRLYTCEPKGSDTHRYVVEYRLTAATVAPTTKEHR